MTSPIRIDPIAPRIPTPDLETISCGDFSRLQHLVAKQGGNLLIERALAIGQVPLKVVDDVKPVSTSATAQNVNRRTGR